MNTNTNGRGHFDPSSFDEHPPALNGAPNNLAGSPSNTFQQYGSSQPLSTSTFNTTPGPQGQFRSPAPSESFDRRRGPQSPVALKVPHHVEQPRSGLDGRPSPSEHPQWVPGDNSRNGGLPLQGHPGEFVNMGPPAKPVQSRRPSHSYNPPPPPPNDAPDFSPRATTQYCRIPGCGNKAYYDFAEQEQTEYCGQGHELQAISTGLVNRCAMCKGRPRRTGERVCGRTCRERERQSAQVQGSYYGVPVNRREPRGLGA